MDNFKLLTEHSIWWIFPALVCSFFFSLLFYKKDKREVSKSYYWTLVSLRALLLFSLLFLLINPLVNYFKNKINPPHAVIVVDDSESILNAGFKREEILEAVRGWEKVYAQKGIKSHVLNLGGERISDSIKFNRSITDLDQVLNGVIDNFQSENLASITLLTDGIVNQGQSPYYKNYGQKINIVGIGNTLQIVDAAIYKINVNAVSFASKKIPIEVVISAKGLQGKNLSIALFKGSETIQEHRIVINQNEEFVKHTFYVTEEKEGIYPYSVRVNAREVTEKIINNNNQKVYLKVIEKSQKILVLAEMPHPDLKFIRSVLQENQAYNLTFEIRSHGKTFSPKWKDYDLIILHGGSNPFIKMYSEVCIENQISFVLFSALSTMNGVGMDLSILRFEKDEVQCSLNKEFKSILLSQGVGSSFDNTPPIEVPFGEIKSKSNSEVVAFQKVGTVETDKPLVVLTNEGSYRTSRVLGSGWWKIRLRNKENAKYFDELFGKIFEYALTNQYDKNLVLKSLRDEYSIQQPARIEIKTYDLLGEQVLGNKVSLTLFKEGKKLRKVNTTVNSKSYQYNFNDLEPGVYRVEGSFTLADKPYKEKVEFAVNNTSLEGKASQADFSRMEAFAKTHKGVFLKFDTKDVNWISTENAPNTITSIEDVFSVIEYKWIVIFILLLAFSEWILRKVKLLD